MRLADLSFFSLCQQEYVSKVINEIWCWSSPIEAYCELPVYYCILIWCTIVTVFLFIWLDYCSLGISPHLRTWGVSWALGAPCSHRLPSLVIPAGSGVWNVWPLARSLHTTDVCCLPHCGVMEEIISCVHDRAKFTLRYFLFRVQDSSWPHGV